MMLKYETTKSPEDSSEKDCPILCQNGFLSFCVDVVKFFPDFNHNQNLSQMVLGKMKL